MVDVTNSNGIGVFIKSLYDIAIALVGLAVFVQFLRAGFTYFLAAGNASEVSHGKSLMQNAILGGLLLLSSYLILNVINPDLLKLDLFKPIFPADAPPPPVYSIVNTVNEIPINSDTTADSAAGHGPDPVIKAQVILDALAKANISVAPNVIVAGMRAETINGLLQVRGDCSECSMTLTKGTETYINGDRLKFTITSEKTDKFVETMMSTYEYTRQPLVEAPLALGGGEAFFIEWQLGTTNAVVSGKCGNATLVSDWICDSDGYLLSIE